MERCNHGQSPNINQHLSVPSRANGKFASHHKSRPRPSCLCDVVRDVQKALLLSSHFGDQFKAYVIQLRYVKEVNNSVVNRSFEMFFKTKF